MNANEHAAEAPRAAAAQAGSARIQSLNPATGEVWQEYDAATPAQVQAAVAGARAAHTKPTDAQSRRPGFGAIHAGSGTVARS